MNWRKGARKLRHASEYLIGKDDVARKTVEMLMTSVLAEPGGFWIGSFTIWIFEWLRWIAQVIRLMVWRWRLSKARIDPNAKCPSCGAREGDIRFDAHIAWPDGSKGAVLHHCKIDQAVWAEKTIVKAESWRVEGYQEPEGRSDTPIIGKPAAVTSAQARRRSQPSFKEV